MDRYLKTGVIMLKDKVVELAKERAELVAAFESCKIKLDKKNAELLEAIKDVNETAVELVESKPRKIKKAQAQTPKAQSSSSDGQPRHSMKEVVQDIILKNPDGITLQGIVDEVDRRIKAGEYSSKSSKRAPLVSQALHQLKNDNLIQPKKTEDKRRLYVAQAVAV